MMRTAVCWSAMSLLALGPAVFAQGAAPEQRAGPTSNVSATVVGEKTEKATYLGVSTTPVPPALRDQLNLPRGVGLVVAFIDPEGAAVQSGIRQHDVLVKMNDQWLVNAQQLAVLVRMHKPGDEVMLTLYRGGQEIRQPATLIERELLVLEAQLDALGLRPPHVPLPPPMGDLPEEGTLSDLDDVSIEWLDDQHRLVLTDRQDQRWLHVQDRSGKTLFDGPVQTEAQRQALPEAVRHKLKKLETKAIPPVVPEIQGGR